MREFVDDFIPLPGQYEINEYRMMERFIYELPMGREQDVLEQARSFELRKCSGLRKAALIERILECLLPSSLDTPLCIYYNFIIIFIKAMKRRVIL